MQADRPGRREGRAAPAFTFARHYGEMVLAMAVGMAIYGVLLRSPLDPIGYSAVLHAHPYIDECLMLVAMSLPMIAFMWHRNHGWGRTSEMVFGMVLPSVVVICVAATAVVPALTGIALSLSSHVAMLFGMLLAMLYRRDEYAGVHAHGDAHGYHHS